MKAGNARCVQDYDPHHQTAVEMPEKALEDAEHPELKELAQKTKTVRARGGNGERSSGGRLYTAVAVSVRRTYLFSLAILVTLLVSLYPYLGAMEMCHPGECPYATHTSTQSSAGTAGIVGLCLGAVLAASSAGVAFGALRGLRFVDNDPRPGDVFLSFDPPPPRAGSRPQAPSAPFARCEGP